MTESEVAELLGSSLANMSVYEAIDLQLQRTALLRSTEETLFISITIYLTMISAFLAAAYVGGSKLNRTQTIIGSSIFTVASGYLVLTIMGLIQGINFQHRAIGLHYQQMAEQYDRPDWLIFGESIYKSGLTGWHELMILGLLGAGIIASLYFMWSVRHAQIE